ncbi:uncharacterized protein LOC126797634 [Argentina anserina]|uniref:uncharacterized protein LOC126797634 n=1 Tax=Argentina anserina TaxID=57926 RepID=UPI0021766983|nr:uncharacterized protein LOC126797634 [Potentilla anserina]
MARIRKHGVDFSGEGGVDDSDLVGEETNEGSEEREKLGPVDMEIDGKGREGLDGAQVGGSDVNAESGKGLVSESKDDSKEVEGLVVVVDKDGGKDEVLRECLETGVVGAVEGSDSMHVEAKEEVTVEGEDELMRDVKEEEVVRVGEEEKEREQNVECSKVEHVATGLLEEIQQDIPAVEVKVASVDESVRDGDLNVSPGSQTLEVNVGVKTSEDVKLPENVPPAGDSSVMAVDLEPYSETDESDSDDIDVSGSSKPKFQAWDLVWGKVRSHPWWPGQICDPSTSSRQAKKYFKKHRYLIAYFWDCTFAWNEASQIKPFWENFSQMEKQSNMEEFQDAVGCALDEVSRRVEFGLTCSCISEEVYAKLKTQTIMNGGIKEEASRRDGGDSSLGAASFEPLKLIKFAKQAAKLPLGRADRLELVASRAQLSSFNRWKGYSQLPEFNFLGGLLEHDADISLLRQKEQVNVLREDALPIVKDKELEQKSKGKSSAVYKRKHISGDNSQPSKKGKKLSNVTAEKCLSTPEREYVSERKSGCKMVPQSVIKKRNAVDGAKPDDSAVKHSKITKISSSAVEDCVSPQKKQTFKVGDRICRVATLLNGSSPIFKQTNAAPADAEVEDEGKEKSTSQEPQTEKLIDMEDPSPDEKLSHLCLAAMNPNKGYSMMNSLLPCFSKYRNTVCLEPPSPDEDQLPLRKIFGGKLGKKSSKTGKKSIKACTSTKSDLGLVKDSSSDKIVKTPNDNGELLLGTANDKDSCIVELQSSLNSEALKPGIDIENGELVGGAATSDKDTSTVVPQASLGLKAILDSEQNIACGDLDPKAVKPVLGKENGALDCELSSVVESPADPKVNPNLNPEQETAAGGTGSEAMKSALDNENEELIAGVPNDEDIAAAECQETPKLKPNLDSEQENGGGGTDLEAVRPDVDTESGELVAGALSNEDACAVESQASLEFNPNMDSAQTFADGDHGLESVKPALLSETSEEDSPAALILNFSDLESLPSEVNLNRIFSCFGPLNESQTELLKKTNRAKVVFKRRSDAQKAFSSAGKYSTFGPSLQSYRLKYPLSPSKASSSSPKVAKQGKMDASVEGDTAREL